MGLAKSGLVKGAVATGLAGAAWKRREDLQAAGRRLLAKDDRDKGGHHEGATADRAPRSPVEYVPNE